MAGDQSTLEDLAAKQAITEVIHRYCRAMDRMDRDLALSCWHPGGTDDHSPDYAGAAEGFIDWLWPLHSALAYTRHRCGNVLIRIDGDAAAVAESYCDITLRARRAGETFDVFLAGRYLDRFECIRGAWALRHRQSITEWRRVARAELKLSAFDPPLFEKSEPGPNSAGAGARARRDASDPSYELLAQVTERRP